MVFTREICYSAFHKNSFVNLNRGKRTEIWKVLHNLYLVFPLLFEELYLLLHWLPSVYDLLRMLPSKTTDNWKLIHIPGNCRSQTSSADWDAQSGHVTTGGGWDVGFYMTSESNVWFCQSNSSLMMLAASVSYVTLILQVHSVVRCTLLHHMTFSHSSPPILSFSSPLFFCTITPSIFHPLISSFLPVLLHSDRSLLSASIHRR